MCQNARKLHHSEAKNPKIFWGGARPPLLTLTYWGGGHRLPKPHPLGAFYASSLAPSALNLSPQTKILDPRVCVESKKFLILYYVMMSHQNCRNRCVYLAFLSH